MQDTPQSALDAIRAERTRIFSRQWFRDLLAGRLGPGDTFWLGNYGTAMVIVPLVMLLAMILAISAPAAMPSTLAAIAALVGLYRITILRALVVTTRAAAGPNGWRWTGVVWTGIEAALLLGYALRALWPGIA